MTNEEWQAWIEQMQARQDRTQAQLDQTQAVITALADRQAEHDERIARFERSYIAIANLLQTHDAQLERLTDGLNDLTGRMNSLTENLNNLVLTVNRYITARGSNGSGES